MPSRCQKSYENASQWADAFYHIKTVFKCVKFDFGQGFSRHLTVGLTTLP